MTNDLDHLPHAKRHELAFVVDVIRKGFAFAIGRRTMPKLRGGRLLKIILFGSYARGDWVDDPVGGYKSDYDLLIVVNDDRLTDFEVWSAAEDRLMREVTINNSLTNTSGAAPSFAVGQSPTSGNAQDAQNALFTVNSIDVESASNTVTDAIPGATIETLATTAAPEPSTALTAASLAVGAILRRRRRPRFAAAE